MMIAVKLTTTTVMFMEVDELQYTVILMSTAVKFTISIVVRLSYELTTGNSSVTLSQPGFNDSECYFENHRYSCSCG